MIRLVEKYEKKMWKSGEVGGLESYVSPFALSNLLPATVPTFHFLLIYLPFPSHL
jgi:hypothetical protein